jgi:hypothetical protein
MFLIDMILCGILYVFLIYMMFKSRRKRRGQGGNDGGTFQLAPPQIDLPPGISWPVDNLPSPQKEEERVY